MVLKKIKFGDKEVSKKEFYANKKAIKLDSVDLDKIIVSNKWKINETTYKYLCGYLNNDVIQTLCVVLPQMDGYIKYFDDGGKNMSFDTDDEKIYDKYNKIREVIRKLLKVNLTVGPVRDDKYLTVKLKIFNKVNKTKFAGNIIPLERQCYNCIPAINIDSVLKIDNKRVYPQAYLEQCKYKRRKERVVNFIDDKIVDDDDSDIDDAIDSHLNFSVSSKESAGLDLYSSIDIELKWVRLKKINTGICISVPKSSYGSIRDKSSLASKGLLTLGGVIDSDYTGDIIVIMTSLTDTIKIKKGRKIAQLIVSNITYPEIKKFDSLKETERNNKGFGEMDVDNYKLR